MIFIDTSRPLYLSGNYVVGENLSECRDVLEQGLHGTSRKLGEGFIGRSKHCKWTRAFQGGDLGVHEILVKTIRLENVRWRILLTRPAAVTAAARVLNEPAPTAVSMMSALSYRTNEVKELVSKITDG